MINIIQNSLENSISYTKYNDYMQNAAEQKSTSGSQQTEDRINYTKLNASRMKRLNRTIKLTDEQAEKFNNFQKQTWLVLTETWCGDAAQTLPVLNKIAETTENIDLRIVFRDENLDLMNQFLTNGGQAIPIVVMLDENHQVINSWGSRSTAATKIVEDYKLEHGAIDDTLKKDLQLWYNKDKGKSIIEDFLALV